MFRTILVPLDGSPFAEQALPYALSIARRGGATLDLARVHVSYAAREHSSGALPFNEALDVAWKREEQLYLDGAARRLRAIAPVEETTALLPGLDAESILDRARLKKANLIVMATHGRGSLARFVLGSVTDEVIRQSPVPVLAIRPHDEVPELAQEPVLEEVLVALDGSSLAEAAIGPALELIRLTEGRFTLLRVVDPGEGRAAEAEARIYLHKIADKLRLQGVSVDVCVSVDVRPAEAIIKEARRHGAHLIALATHGRSGIRRVVLGSVADKVLRATDCPVLVCRPTS